MCPLHFKIPVQIWYKYIVSALELSLWKYSHLIFRIEIPMPIRLMAQCQIGISIGTALLRNQIEMIIILDQHQEYSRSTSRQQLWFWLSGLILGLHPANERWRYFVMKSLIGWVQA